MEDDNWRKVQGKACLYAIFNYETVLVLPGYYEMMSSFHKCVWVARSVTGSLKTCSADSTEVCSFGKI